MRSLRHAGMITFSALVLCTERGLSWLFSVTPAVEETTMKKTAPSTSSFIVIFILTQSNLCILYSVAGKNNYMVKVKVKLSLCLTKHHTMKTYWGVEV